MPTQITVPPGPLTYIPLLDDNGNVLHDDQGNIIYVGIEQRNDQPYFTILYNTDQFIDPIYGFTVHDNGLLHYMQPQTGQIYTKKRTYNGQSGGYISYRITLIPPILTTDAGIQLTSDTGKLLTPDAIPPRL